MSGVSEWMRESFVPLLVVLFAIIAGTIYLDRHAEAVAGEPQVTEISRAAVLAQVGVEGGSAAVVAESDTVAKHPAVLAARKALARGDERGALARLTAALAAEGDRAVLLNEQAVIALRGDRAAEALAALDRAVAVAPKDYRAHYNRGVALAKLGRTDEALAAYDQVMALRATHFSTVYSRGLLLIRLNRLDEAVKALRKATKMGSGTRRARAYTGLGLAYARLKQLQPSAKAYRKAVEYQPNAVGPRYNLAVLLLEQGGPAGRIEVRQLLGQIKALQPNFAQAWFLEGRMASAAGDDAAAFTAYQTAAKKDPSFWKARNNAGIVALRLERVDAAAGIFAELARAYPNRAEFQFQLGRVEYVRKDFTAAMDRYTKAISLAKGDYLQAQVNQGLCLRSLKRLPEALQTFDALLAKHPSNAGLHLNRGLTLMKTKAYAEARQAFGQALALRKGYVAALYNLAKLEKAAGQPAAAEVQYKAVLALRSTHRGALVNLGSLYASQKRFDEAEAVYRQAIKAHASYSRAWLNLGVALSKQDRYGDAIKAYEQVLALDPAHASARRYLGSALVRSNQGEAGLKVLRDALEQSPADVTTRHTLALELRRLDRDAEAEQALRRCIKLDPKGRRPYETLASLLLSSDRADEVVQALEPTLSGEPSALMRARLGRAYHLQSRYDLARTQLIAALARKPKSVEVLSSLSKVEAALGDYERAVALVKRALKRRPKSALLKRRLKRFEAKRAQ